MTDGPKLSGEERVRALSHMLAQLGADVARGLASNPATLAKADCIGNAIAADLDSGAAALATLGEIRALVDLLGRDSYDECDSRLSVSRELLGKLLFALAKP